MTELMESHNIHTCLIPPNITDCLQPMDVVVNKLAEAFLKQKLQTRYAEQISVQLGDEASVEDAIESIDLCIARMKEGSASWLVEMWDYIMNNSQFIVNGFLHARISKALDGEDDGEIPIPEVTVAATVTSEEDEEPDNSFVDYTVF